MFLRFNVLKRSRGRRHVRGAVHEQRVDLHRRSRGEPRVEEAGREGNGRRNCGERGEGEEGLAGVDREREKLQEKVSGDDTEDSAPKDQRRDVQEDTDQVFR